MSTSRPYITIQRLLWPLSLLVLASLACTLLGEPAESNQTYEEFLACADLDVEVRPSVDELRDCVIPLSLEDIEIIKNDERCIQNPDCLLVLQEEIDYRDARDEDVSDAVEEAPELNLISAEVRDVSCDQEDSDSYNCKYTLAWSLEYVLPPEYGMLVCGLRNFSVNELIVYKSNFPATRSGKWEDSHPVTGWYAALGATPEEFYCEMLVPDQEGEVIQGVNTEIIVPLQ